MKNYFLILVFFLSSCLGNFYGDKDLGADFYYMVEPSFNSIFIASSRDNPYESLGPYVIKDVESLGFNDQFILVSAKNNDTVIKYYLIDKVNELKRNYEDRLLKTNLIEIDSLEFTKISETYKITIKTNEEYRKENGWK
ncbi:MAG: hypothetical protein NWQ31_12565 [Polaribacter sp.]|nr:hypothetical protein [Polaribacter sp.]